MTANRDKALIEEAINRVIGPCGQAVANSVLCQIVQIALELERSGWQPTDPDVLAVREITAAALPDGGPISPYAVLNGDFDHHPKFQAALAAYKKHKGEAR